MAALDLATRIERNPDLVFTEMDGETVMMSLEQDEYFGLGGVGSRIWELLAQPTTGAQIRDEIVAQYEVESEACERDVLHFLHELDEAGLIRRC